MPMPNPVRPVLLGRLAVYAPDLQIACHVYVKVMSETPTATFGTVRLDNGEEVDWVDMGRGVVLPDEQQQDLPHR